MPSSIAKDRNFKLRLFWNFGFVTYRHSAGNPDSGFR